MLHDGCQPFDIAKAMSSGEKSDFVRARRQIDACRQFVPKQLRGGLLARQLKLK